MKKKIQIRNKRISLFGSTKDAHERANEVERLRLVSKVSSRKFRRA
jgi:hypothetical protein